jgi:hypothetical protein
MVASGPGTRTMVGAHAPTGERVKPLRLLLTAAVGLALAAGATAAAKLPLAPLSSAGPLAPAPAPGPLSLELVPIPTGATLVDPQAVRLGETIRGIPCQSAEKVAFHIHARLTIFVDGKARQVPYGIGIGPPLYGQSLQGHGVFVTSGSCFMWLHTHAADGVIHMEAPRLTTFTLGQFFAIWGAPLSKAQVGPAKGKVTAFYNGQVWTGDPAQIPLSSELQIQLDVGKPVVAPEHITFPKGLAPAKTTK